MRIDEWWFCSRWTAWDVALLVAVVVLVLAALGVMT